MAPTRLGGDLPSNIEERHSSGALQKRDHEREFLDLLYPQQNFSIPIDHFPSSPRYIPHSQGKFNVSYWFDDAYYKPGGPVFVLLMGETAGHRGRYYLQKGIVQKVTKATNGLGVIMEHRYYGTSQPFNDLSVQSLRFLSTEQALADVDYFARNVKFAGIKENLTALNTPWIVYGGSYPGAQAAFLRKTYPKTFFGAIASSAATKPVYSPDGNWEYFEPIRQHANPETVKNTQFLVDVIDKILMKKPQYIKQLKQTFLLPNVTDDRDFAAVFANDLYTWQNINWDPARNAQLFDDPRLQDFRKQRNLTTTLNNQAVSNLRPSVKQLLQAAGYAPTTGTENILLNMIHYLNITQIARQREYEPESQDAFFGFAGLSPEVWQSDSLNPRITPWPRAWCWQVCTEWGFAQTGSTPSYIKPLISRTNNLEYSAIYCQKAFNITTVPKYKEVHKYGGYDIEYDRLAFIGGNADPWKPSSPLADQARKRSSTTNKPIYEIAFGIHHWEQNGLFDNETTTALPPPQVANAQKFIVNFVKEWLKAWRY
ncbi:hypothetical protein M011DRAFT_480460 [Sporormia fimetaria CBS 119925]|uniref:Peptidase S28 n=1 Tax=Sporormia fimetaria CBS 119925 TaxID=1340428 RepID=A0A6A6UZM0_9PLEO|nr:hypothetical protein M011DRAFT_480460 [Sporormia fimetaria CBS 119925]